MAGVKVVQLKGNKKYQDWIAENGDKIEIIDVQSSAIRWNAWTGFVGAALKGDKHYTVTYREKDQP